MIRFVRAALFLAALTATACGKPSVNSLRDSFAQQVAANRLVKDFQRNGDELLFSAPDGPGNAAKWRIHIDSSVIETTNEETGVYGDGQVVVVRQR